MNPLTLLLTVVFVAILVFVAFMVYRRILRRAKGIERGLKMVPIRIFLPALEVKETDIKIDPREQMRRKLAQAETLYGIIAGSAAKGFKSNFYGQRHVSFEIVATDGTIHFYTAVPVALVPVVTQAIISAYPTAQLEEVEDYNPFSEPGKIAGTVGGELILKDSYIHPLQTYHELETDPLEALLNTLSSLQAGEGAAVQLLIRPAGKKWVNAANKFVRQRRRNPGASSDLSFTGKDLARAAIKSPEQRLKEHPQVLTGIEEDKIKGIEEKAKHPGFEALVRLVVSTEHHERSQAVLTQLATAFALLEAPGRNGLKMIAATNVEGLVTAFIFRFFPPELDHMILNSVELATIFHLPEAHTNTTAQVERQRFHEVDGPVNLPKAGLLFGYNTFRGVQKEVRLDTIDRRRHTYIVGQTGTGKSTLLENLAVQDMLNGDGFAFIDPHGDTAERILTMVPKHRAEDVVYFNPGDTSRPLGLNLFEFHSPEQKDFIIQESIGMLYKLYDPGHTGIIGPRYEHWFRNAALTLMSDPEGATFIEIPKVFTDNEYLKQKFKHVRDQTVIDFWTQEMAQTSDYHKSEMLGWFVSKFGAFMSNEIMRNIIGQTKSAFDLRQIMDQKKILIVNLSKGLIGELNSQLLGMILVIKFQAAAMSRADVDENQRNDFCLYVDEFQNFSTDSFATILSEARKYRLNLTVANQFIGQLSEDVRDAVFGNVGSIVSFRTGPEDAEFLVKQFSPVFDTHDLVNVPNGYAAVRMMVGGLPSQPFSIHALPPIHTNNLEMGEAVKQLSAAKFGLVKAQVEAEISARLGAGAPIQPPAAEPVAATPAPEPTAQAPTPPPSNPQPAAPVPDDGATLNITPRVPDKPAAAEPVQPEAATPPPPAVPEPSREPVAEPVAATTLRQTDSDESSQLNAPATISSTGPLPDAPSSKRPEPVNQNLVRPRERIDYRQDRRPNQPVQSRPGQPRPNPNRYNRVVQPPRPEPASSGPQPRPNDNRGQNPRSHPQGQFQTSRSPHPAMNPATQKPAVTPPPAQPQAQNVSTTTPIPTPVANQPIPKLQPGEVHVDEHGNVHRGE